MTDNGLPGRLLKPGEVATLSIGDELMDEPTAVEVPLPTIEVENPAFTAWVERRAIDLCVDAVPEHTEGRPCFTHLQMARREGLAAWHPN